MYNLYHFFNELIITAFAVTILLSVLPQTSVSLETCSNICIDFVIICWAMNLFCSLYSSVCNYIEKIKECIRKYRAKRAKLYRITTNPDQDFPEEKTVDITMKINKNIN